MAILGDYINLHYRRNFNIMKQLLIFFSVFYTWFASAQLNIDSLSHISYQQLHGANLNDVWGYEDELGNEYAIVGTSKGTSIVDITNPVSYTHLTLPTKA